MALIVLLEGLLLGVNAVEVAGLDLTRTWNVGTIEIEGNTAFSGKTLKKIFQTKSKNKYLPFKHPPEFDPVVFLADLEQLKLFYETHGYYDVHIRYDLAPEPEKDGSILLLCWRKACLYASPGSQSTLPAKSDRCPQGKPGSRRKSYVPCSKSAKGNRLTSKNTGKQRLPLGDGS